MVLPADSVWTSSQTISCIIIKYNKRYNAQGSNKWWTCVSIMGRKKKTWLFFTNTATKITKCGHTDTKKQK